PPLFYVHSSQTHSGHLLIAWVCRRTLLLQRVARFSTVRRSPDADAPSRSHAFLNDPASIPEPDRTAARTALTFGEELADEDVHRVVSCGFRRAARLRRR